MLSQSTIKKIRSLHKKKFRKDFGEFIVEGSKAVNELLNSDYEVISHYATESVPGVIRTHTISANFWRNGHAKPLDDIGS